MSLKARIEAVIYAAEEPVTLPQLAAIFRDEALVSRAARLSVFADPEAPTEEDLASLPEVAESEVAESGPAEAGPSEAGAAEAVPSDLLPPQPSAAFTEAHPPQSEDGAERAVPSESAAQNSSDAAVAVPDFAGQPQPFPAQPPEATTSDPPIPPETGGDPWAEPATNAVEFPSDEESAPETQQESAPETPDENASPSQDIPALPPALTPEEEKRLARQREREVREEIRRLIDELIAEYAASDRGLEIREIAGGFRMATRAEYHDAVRTFVRSLKPPMKLSLQALETLAVIAYKQPITAPEIADIRGVDSGGVLGSLVARKLITTAGRKQVIGRPILYKTTREFLLRFGLKDLAELPSLEEFEKMASELADQEEPSEQLPLAHNAGAEEDTALEADEEEPAPASEAADEPLLSPAEPEVGAAAAEPAEFREESEPEAPEASSEESPGEENPEPALAGAESNPEPAPTTEHDRAQEPGDGNHPPSHEESPAPHPAAEEGQP